VDSESCHPHPKDHGNPKPDGVTLFMCRGVVRLPGGGVGSQCQDQEEATQNLVPYDAGRPHNVGNHVSGEPLGV
jgi:hypothetical protein